MAQRDEKPPFSLQAFVELTARMLRDAVKPSKKKDRKFSESTGLSNKNKIGRIASLLRSEAKKSKRGKKKKSR